MKQPILKGPRLTLRSAELADAPAFVKWFKDKKVVKYLFKQEPISLPAERKFIKKTLKDKNKLIWSIISEEGELIGNTGLTLKPDHKLGNWGIVIGEKSEWGKGYAGETIKLVLNYFFGKLKYNRFELEVYLENKRARRAYEKAGFVWEGVRREALWNKITKRFSDSAMLSVLRREYLKISHK